MMRMRHIIGLDISTQTVTAMLISVAEEHGSPSELIISGGWMESRSCRDLIGRKSPAVWLELVRECIEGLKKRARETELAEAIGVSTTFPGCFTILADGSTDHRLVSLYDNSDDSGICEGHLEEALVAAEGETLNRMWAGNTALGLVHLVKECGLSLSAVGKIVPLSTAFAYGVLRAAGYQPDLAGLMADFTQATISGLYDSSTGRPVPPGVERLLKQLAPEIDADQLRSLLPELAPSWRNAIPSEALGDVRALLGLPKLVSLSIGAGDSPLGVLALMSDRDTVINVRGSSDSPMILVDRPLPRQDSRETVLHYPLVTATSLADAPWCVVAPMLRSGRVWDWVRGLRFDEDTPDADARLEALALEASRSGRTRVRFDTALGGERAPSWDPHATGSLAGLVESHTIGDIALAALNDMTAKLRGCIEVMETRYQVEPRKMLLAGGPARNNLWNWITSEGTGKETFATTFSNASLVGAALLGYAALYSDREPDTMISRRLFALSKLSSHHPLIAPVPVAAPE